MAKKTTHNAKQVIEAIKGSGGIKKKIAESLKVHRHTVDGYLERWETVKEAYIEEVEGVTDIAENELIKLIKSGDFPAVKYYLSTKGKSRGYTERQEITGAEGESLTVRINYAND